MSLPPNNNSNPPIQGIRLMELDATKDLFVESAGIVISKDEANGKLVFSVALQGGRMTRVGGYQPRQIVIKPIGAVDIADIVAMFEQTYEAEKPKLTVQ